MRMIEYALNLISVSLLLLCCMFSVPFMYSKFLNQPVYTDSSFNKYLDDFKSDAKRYKVDLDLYKLITVFSSDVESGIAAYCVPQRKLVVVSRRAWYYLDSVGRKALLYHEWGHCILRRDHVDTISEFPMPYCPVSLMYPSIELPSRCYGNSMESYNRELFTNPFNFKQFSRSW